jgi:hypothetical protein
MIKTIVAAAKSRSGKMVDFVIASNLALLDDVILGFCKANIFCDLDVLNVVKILPRVERP